MLLDLVVVGSLSEGKHLGTILGPEHPHNLAWGEADRKTLYLAPRTGFYGLALNVAGAGEPK